MHVLDIIFLIVVVLNLAVVSYLTYKVYNHLDGTQLAGSPAATA